MFNSLFIFSVIAYSGLAICIPKPQYIRALMTECHHAIIIKLAKICVFVWNHHKKTHWCGVGLFHLATAAAATMHNILFVRTPPKCKQIQQVLLVFPKNDDVCDILQDACSRLEMDTFLSQTLPEAIESFQNITNGGHNLIIVDGRLPQILDPETVARYAFVWCSSILFFLFFSFCIVCGREYVYASKWCEFKTVAHIRYFWIIIYAHENIDFILSVFF